MAGFHDHDRLPDRLRDLLADRALGFLDADGTRELADLDERSQDDAAGSLDRAAAALHMALLLGESEPMPASVRERLELDATDLMGRGPATND